MALWAIHQAQSSGGSITSVNLGESFMVTGKEMEGRLGIYLFKPFSRLAGLLPGVYGGHPLPHFFKEGPSLIPEARA